MIQYILDSEVRFDVSFNHKHNIFLTDSGEGKTYLFTDSNNLQSELGIKIVYYNNENINALKLFLDSEKLFESDMLVILDDIESLVNRYNLVIDKILESGAIFVYSAKTMRGLERILLQDCGFYKLKEDNGCFVTKEIWSC